MLHLSVDTGPDVTAAKHVDFMQSVPFFSVIAGLRAKCAALAEENGQLQARIEAKDEELARLELPSQAGQRERDQEVEELGQRFVSQQARYKHLTRRTHELESDLKRAQEDLARSRAETEDERVAHGKLKDAYGLKV